MATCEGDAALAGRSSTTVVARTSGASRVYAALVALTDLATWLPPAAPGPADGGS